MPRLPLLPVARRAAPAALAGGPGQGGAAHRQAAPAAFRTGRRPAGAPVFRNDFRPERNRAVAWSAAGAVAPRDRCNGAGLRVPR